MNERRKLIGAKGAFALQAPFGALAQNATAAPRVVLVIAGSVRTQPERVNAFRKRLRELGYTEGKNLIVELRELDGKVDQLPAIMREIVQSNPAVIVTHGASTQAARAATSTIPGGQRHKQPGRRRIGGQPGPARWQLHRQCADSGTDL